MSFSLQPEYEQIKNRYHAFWVQEVIDRPLVSIVIPVENPEPIPQKIYTDFKSQWLDVSFRAEQIDIELSNQLYLGDALPTTFPNMGPEIFSAWCGCGYQFGETTTWSESCVHSWEEDYNKISLDMNHPYLKATLDYTNALLEKGKGKFIVGLPDFHPGGDHLAAMRDPSHLAMDMIDNVQWLKKTLHASYPDFHKIYDLFYGILRTAGMPITSWLDLIYEGKYYIPSNDFSCMISPDMFNDMFLPGIIEECRFLDKSIYHLDGPGALKHLDVLLDIRELDAIQWVCGAGNEDFKRWIPIYQKIQKAGKSLQILELKISELDLMFENLNPEGVYIKGIKGVDDRETAEKVLKRIERWR